MEKFWRWRNEAEGGRILELSGVIASESWFDDEVSPVQFKSDLMAGSGDITVWINSPGGDCVAAAQIYNMLMEYPHEVTVKIDGIADSAASVIAMAGTQVLMSPVSMMMIHNPQVCAFGDHVDMAKAIDMLDAVKDSIINAYEIKTGMSRAKLSHLMDAETWMDAGKAAEMGFCDGLMQRSNESPPAQAQMCYSEAAVCNSLMEKIAARCRIEKKTEEEPAGRPVSDLKDRLLLLKH